MQATEVLQDGPRLQAHPCEVGEAGLDLFRGVRLPERAKRQGHELDD